MEYEIHTIRVIEKVWTGTDYEVETWEEICESAGEFDNELEDWRYKNEINHNIDIQFNHITAYCSEVIIEHV